MRANDRAALFLVTHVDYNQRNFCTFFLAKYTVLVVLKCNGSAGGAHFDAKSAGDGIGYSIIPILSVSRYWRPQCTV